MVTCCFYPLVIEASYSDEFHITTFPTDISSASDNDYDKTLKKNRKKHITLIFAHFTGLLFPIDRFHCHIIKIIHLGIFFFDFMMPFVLCET